MLLVPQPPQPPLKVPLLKASAQVCALPSPLNHQVSPRYWPFAPILNRVPPTEMVYGASVGNVVSLVAVASPLHALPASFTAKKVLMPIPAAWVMSWLNMFASVVVACRSQPDQLLVMTLAPC